MAGLGTVYKNAFVYDAFSKYNIVFKADVKTPWDMPDRSSIPKLDATPDEDDNKKMGLMGSVTEANKKTFAGEKSFSFFSLSSDDDTFSNPFQSSFNNDTFDNPFKSSFSGNFSFGSDDQSSTFGLNGSSFIFSSKTNSAYRSNSGNFGFSSINILA